MVTQGGSGGTVNGYSAYVTGMHWTENQYHVATDSAGSNVYHNNISACIAVYAWRRTA